MENAEELKELKARLLAVVAGYKAENIRFVPIKNLQIAAEKFQKAKDKTSKAEAKIELKTAFLAVSAANFVLNGAIKTIFDHCSKVFVAAPEKEDGITTKIIICRHITPYQNNDCSKYTQMSIVLGKQNHNSTKDSADAELHFNPPFNVERYTWAATSKTWLPEFDPQLPPANETISSFSDATEARLYKQFVGALTGNLAAYIKAYEKIGGQKYPLATANSTLWKAHKEERCTFWGTWSLSTLDYDGQGGFVLGSASVIALTAMLNLAFTFFENAHTINTNILVSIPLQFIQANAGLTMTTIISNFIRTAITNRLQSAYMIEQGLIQMPTLNIEIERDRRNTNVIQIVWN